MSPEVVATLAVGVGLATLTLTGQRAIRADLHALTERVASLEARAGGIAERVARLEGAFPYRFLPAEPDKRSR